VASLRHKAYVSQQKLAKIVTVNLPGAAASCNLHYPVTLKDKH
jgi:hypothetical protein